MEERRTKMPVPYVPYSRERVEDMIKDAHNYIAEAVQVLEETIPRDLYQFVSDADVALMSIVLSSDPRMAEDVAAFIIRQIFAWLDSR
jgi:hypothetical protein